MLLIYRAVIPSRPNRVVPLLVGLAVGAILAGTGLALAVDAPRSALPDGTGGTADASVAPTVDIAPTPAVPSTVDVPPTVDFPPPVDVVQTVDVVPQPLPTEAAPDRAIDVAAPRAEPSTLTGSSTPPKAAPADAMRSEAGAADAQAPARSARQVPGDTIAAVVAATNAERVSAGCLTLRVDDRINTAAQLHSVDMADRRNMSHLGGDGSTFTDRLHAAGYPRPGGENIAFGQPTAASVVADWMASSGHRRNILNCEYTAIGVGFDPRGNYWTQNFGF
ncbi:MAG: CAP domain-containing protein [Pseudonocardiales bacterium]